MTLRQMNRALQLQSRMTDEHEKVIFANALPNVYTGKTDWWSVEAFEAYAFTHPDMRDALHFLHEALAPTHMAKLEQTLCGA